MEKGAEKKEEGTKNMRKNKKEAGKPPAKTVSPANSLIGGEQNKLFGVPDTWPGDLDALPAPELKKKTCGIRKKIWVIFDTPRAPELKKRR